MLEIDLKKVNKKDFLTYEKGKLTFLSSPQEPILLKSMSQLEVYVPTDVKVELIELLTDLNDYQISITVQGELKHQKIYLDNCEEIKIQNTVKNEGGTYMLTIIDLSRCNLKSTVNIGTFIKNSLSDIYCASLCGVGSKKFHNQIVNYAPNTQAYMENYGIAYKNGNLEIVGIGEIKHGAYASTNRQKSNLIVIDSTARASSKPYLYIDENDVEASHASAVGDISEEQLFYLMSRGLDKDLAKRMIILGYFRPVLDRLNDLKIKEQIVNQIKGVIDNV